VALDTQDFVGAKVLDSTTAELSEICHGLRCLLTPKAAPSRPAELCSDSELLIEWVQGTASVLPKETYEALVDSGQALLKDVQQSGRGTRVYVHVKSWWVEIGMTLLMRLHGVPCKVPESQRCATVRCASEPRKAVEHKQRCIASMRCISAHVLERRRLGWMVMENE
jgi:hypothetical protein